MAFPTVQTRNTSAQTGTVTSHTVSLPSGIQSGDLLIVKFGYGVTGNTVDWTGTGFTAITNGAVENAAGSTEGVATAYRWANGSEGTTITVGTSVGCRSNHISLRISGAENPSTQAPEAATSTVNNLAPDPPSLTPTGGAKDYLWIACGGRSQPSADDTITAAPTNYSNFQSIASGSVAAAHTMGATAERQLNAASENPGAFTSVGITGESVAVTIAVHPGASGTTYTKQNIAIADFVGSGGDATTRARTGSTVMARVGITGQGAGQSDFGKTAVQKRAIKFVAPSALLRMIRPALFRANGSPTDDVRMAIYDDNSGSPGSSLANVVIDITDGNADPRDLIFSTTLVANTTYWLVFERTGSISDVDYYATTPSKPNYPTGDVKLHNGSTWSNTTDAYGTLYFSGPTASGIAVKVSGTKSGAGVSAFTASGYKNGTFNRTGAGVSPRVASGADASAFAETGVGVSPFAASGYKNGTFNRTGAAVSARVASGGDATTYAETGVAISNASFPAIVTTTSGVVTSDSSSWTLTYPSGIQAGDLILIFATNDGNTSTATASGFLGVSGTSAGVTFSALKKSASGSESGTFTLTVGAAEQGAWRVLRVNNWRGQIGINWTNSSEGGSVVLSPDGSSSFSADPPSLNPAQWDVEKVLWIAACGLDDGDRTITAFPTGYGLSQLAQESGGIAGAAQGSAAKNNEVASEDPSAFALDAGGEWHAFTIAVRPNVDGFTGGGGDATTYVEAGTATSAFTASGYEPISFYNLGASANPDLASSTDATSYTNTSWTPPTRGLIIVYVMSESTVAAAGIDPSISGNSLTWTKMASIDFPVNTHHKITLFGANASGSTTGATTVSYGSETQGSMMASFFHATGVDLSGGVSAAFVQVQTNLGFGQASSVTLNAAAKASNRPIFGNAHTTNMVQSPRTNWTEVDDLAVTTPTNALETQYRPDAFETTGSSTWTQDEDWGCIAAELKSKEGPPGIPAKAGTAISAFSVSGGKVGTWNRTGAAVSARVASGADATTFVEASAGVAPFTGTADGAWIVNRSGAGVAPFTVAGDGVQTQANAGTAISPFVGSGADASTFVEAGAGVSARVASGADAATSVETGAGIAPFIASGVGVLSGNLYTKTGLAVIGP